MVATRKRQLARLPGVGALIVGGYRTSIALKYVGSSIYNSSANAARWLIFSREYTNFTYDITSLSRNYLAAAVAVVTKRPVSEITRLFDELEQDEELKSHIIRVRSNSPDRSTSDAQIKFGRRLTWYAIARVLKPKMIVETGVDKGLGSCILTSALKRNASEGSGGFYYGTDINPAAGYLLSGDYAKFGEIIYGDSIASLRRLEQNVDLFINDSDHSAEYEAREYDVIEEKLADGAIIIGDNCEVTDALMQFSARTGRKFFFAREESVRHINPGSGVGFAFM